MVRSLRWLAGLSLLLLAACGSPKYQLVTDKIPPSGERGLACVGQCASGRAMCSVSCRETYQVCESDCQSRYQACARDQESAAAKQLPIALVEYNQALRVFHDKLDLYHRQSVDFERTAQRLEDRLHNARHVCASDRERYRNNYFEKHKRYPASVPEKDLAGCIDAELYSARLARRVAPEPPIEPEPVTLGSLTEKLQAERCHTNCGCHLACGCDDQYDSCFLGCGGELRQRRVCVKNCDKI